MLYQGEIVVFKKEDGYCLGVVTKQSDLPNTELTISAGNEKWMRTPTEVRIVNAMFSKPEPVTPTVNYNPFKRPWYKRIFNLK